ncbi:antirestriction protein ArdA [Bifidobacterium sp. UTBIF-68]|uniref:antirestriction protein ArdA n=1 Tax=Bifidobacterium sp. UTBIF-68 TaxID=1465262 RepID=UPI00112692FA|nr:antirestriction protein ArdA [Bifidobacterium sp. UTBIF-68]
MENYEIRVWVGNLGRYTEGDLVGGWITLPQPAEAITKFLRDVVQVDPAHEEYAIFDTENDGALAALDLEIGDYTDVWELNVLAAALKYAGDMHPYEDVCDAVSLAAEQCGAGWPIDYANLAMQVDDIDYTPFPDADDYTLDQRGKLAWSLVESGALPEIKSILDSPLSACIDMEILGRDLQQDYYTSDHGYMSIFSNIPLTDRYTIREIESIITPDDWAGTLIPTRELAAA